MYMFKCLSAGLVATAVAVPAAAEGVKIYPYASAANYCPTGLQPVSINGVICCGEPNQSQSYQQVMVYPVKKRMTRRVSRARMAGTCPEGIKGCY